MKTSLQKTTSILWLTLSLLSNPAKSQSISFYLQAHEDDWQLFMSSQVYQEIDTISKIVFVTLTAGDAGYGDSTSPVAGCYSFYGNGMTPYFRSRENGSVYASKYAWDLINTNPQIQPGYTPVPQTATVSYVDGNGNTVTHSITKYIYNNVVNYFLRLPDGNLDGSGFSCSPDYGQSLQKLQSGIISSISAVDGSATYNGWNDLVQTFNAIVSLENTASVPFWLNVASMNSSNSSLPAYNPNDHSDHYHAANLAWSAFNDSASVGIRSWVDYYSSEMPPNLNDTVMQFASELYGLCEFGKTQGGYTLVYHNSEIDWLPMDYSFDSKSPAANNSSAMKPKKSKAKK